MTYDEAKSVECPVCRVPAGRDCSYVEHAEHNGWAHVDRYDAAARLSTPTPGAPDVL
jgi:hypothetical protein